VPLDPAHLGAVRVTDLLVIARMTTDGTLVRE
jgi:hypothetical protein